MVKLRARLHDASVARSYLMVIMQHSRHAIGYVLVSLWNALRSMMVNFSVERRGANIQDATRQLRFIAAFVVDSCVLALTAPKRRFWKQWTGKEILRRGGAASFELIQSGLDNWADEASSRGDNST